MDDFIVGQNIEPDAFFRRLGADQVACQGVGKTIIEATRDRANYSKPIYRWGIHGFHPGQRWYNWHIEGWARRRHENGKCENDKAGKLEMIRTRSLALVCVSIQSRRSANLVIFCLLGHTRQYKMPRHSDCRCWVQPRSSPHSRCLEHP